jgi:hypothetical protein
MRDAEGDLERGRVLVQLDSDHGLAGDADEVGELLLGHVAVGAQFAHLVADAGGHSEVR